MPLVCLAIVGQQNNPLYIRVLGGVDAEREQKLHFVVHCSLDVIEEKVLLKRVPGELPDSYLGLLYPTEDFRAYGYLTNTNTKLVAVVDDGSLRDEAISKVLRGLHGLYVDAFSSPFFTTPIRSRSFDTQVEQLLAATVQC